MMPDGVGTLTSEYPGLIFGYDEFAPLLPVQEAASTGMQ